MLWIQLRALSWDLLCEFVTLAITQPTGCSLILSFTLACIFSMLVQIDPKITGYMLTQEVLSFGIETGIICGLKPRSIHDALIMVGGPLKGEFFLAHVLMDVQSAVRGSRMS